jgi:hypothetical protein
MRIGYLDKRSNLMCDYSLHATASRPAKVGDILVSTSFPGTSTHGFAAVGEPGVAVCLLPGTELAFEQEVKYNRNWIMTKSAGTQVARFCQVAPESEHQHHDALMFPDGTTVLVTLLSEGQRARVLQLPVTAQEREAASKVEATTTPAPRREIVL